ncbi:hypothetical protein C5167_020999 [Papaver somniferum]|uniref:50S ribosomal protein L14, chloroplastic n=1 Tax=Papaver somniferum TaxID=3469 RepID=A0A4Y7IXQ2_PAPSO|nr:hypothetical protein C5167_020999 [Papaver somniferum]
MGFPKWLIEGKPRGIEELQINVQKGFNSVNRKLNIAITRIAKPYGDPNILAEFIAGQLKNRVSFRKAMKKAIELTEQADTKGIQVQIAGRIDGKEIARVEWIREEAVPNMPLERSEVIRAVIVRTCKELKRDNGMIIRYDDNAAVVIDQEGNPKGTRVFGAIARELRQLNFTKIVSLAPEVL